MTLISKLENDNMWQVKINLTIKYGLKNLKYDKSMYFLKAQNKNSNSNNKTYVTKKDLC